MGVNVSSWIKAFRLRTLPLALACVSLGSFLAWYYDCFRWPVFALSLLTTLFLQMLSNLANDYGDFVKGTDNDNRVGPARTLQAGLISKNAMMRAIILFSILALVSGILLLFVAIPEISATFWIFLALGLVAIFAAVKYTMGENAYGYLGLGDLFVLLFFGPVGVLGTLYLHGLTLYTDAIFPALSSGLLSVAVLNINNLRDIEPDEVAGKNSIPVRIGRKNAVLYHWVVLFLAFACCLYFVLQGYRSPWNYLFVLSLPLLLKNGLSISRNENAQLDPFLKQMAMTALLFVMLFGFGINL